MPDVAQWLAAQAGPADRVASFRLNRWTPAYRFYVGRHTIFLEDAAEAEAFFRAPQPFYCVMRRGCLRRICRARHAVDASVRAGRHVGHLGPRLVAQRRSARALRRRVRRPVVECLDVTLSEISAALFVADSRSRRSRSRSAAAAQPPASAGPFGALRWRSLGPARGGRSIAVAGSDARPYEYYLGATGGGLWKTTDGGITWKPVTDGQINHSSIGAVAVSASNPDVVYIGTGETDIRGNIMQGDGVYKSTDAGKTWTHIGLTETQVIAKIRVHPTNPDLVYVAAFGHHAAPESRARRLPIEGRRQDLGEDALPRQQDRRRRAGLRSEEPEGHLHRAVGGVPQRRAGMSSGGPGSGLFKSTDGGDTGPRSSRNPGLPKAMLGKIGFSVSGADSQSPLRADRSGGRRLLPVGRCRRDVEEGERRPQPPPARVLLLARLRRSEGQGHGLGPERQHLQVDRRRQDAAKPSNVPHGDNHDMWIASNDSNRMIEANDGGANVIDQRRRDLDGQSRCRPRSSTTCSPTTHMPYHVCGAQQDNSTACVSSVQRRAARADPAAAPIRCSTPSAAARAATSRSDPRNPDIFYAGSYGGLLTRSDRRTGQEREINIWPDNPMGYGSADIAERFQWTFPIVIAPTDPRIIYVGSQHVWKSTNEGQSWEKISPDLTRHDPKTMGPSGGPITKDNTGVETYATSCSRIAPSPQDANVIWAGSDDGFVQVTRDGGTRLEERHAEGSAATSRASA